ncbi:hypothetical protein VT91_08970 [Clostridium sporogenes]|nr:hypothetical protein VT28_35820 [Clostridium sporogenes]KRU31985.1 hypothetical protein WG71_04930 [Clostridium sporogenes]KRU34255.1 hypothetical protein VT91_08970 [Clostridium sporogenes]KRU41272.1 hypothetical protein VT95_24990 [Clostridium sporogenes]OQP95459.1 hypothetical protein VT92_0210520 [Clostridium sporogenes]
MIVLLFLAILASFKVEGFEPVELDKNKTSFSVKLFTALYAKVSVLYRIV